MRNRGNRPLDEGSGTIAVVGIIACILLLGLAIVGSASVQAQTTRVQAVADMAALAGAECLQNTTLLHSQGSPGGVEPCGCAGEVASANGLSIGQCWSEGGDVRVVLVDPWTMLSWAVDIRGMARAGPL